jgi:hypothetical protein
MDVIYACGLLCNGNRCPVTLLIALAAAGASQINTGEYATNVPPFSAPARSPSVPPEACFKSGMEVLFHFTRPNSLIAATTRAWSVSVKLL